MKKTDRILQYLTSCDEPQLTNTVAAAIDEADAVNTVSALLSHLKKRGLVLGEQSRHLENAWQITAAGREYFDALIEEASEGAAPAERVIHTTSQPPRKKRGRPPGSRSRPKSATAPAPRKPPAHINGAPFQVHGIRIERGVPLPEKYAQGKWIEIATAMKPGDVATLPAGMGSATLRLAMKKLGMKYTQRSDKNGTRVWRLA